MRTYRPRRCCDCGEEFTPRHGNQKRDDACAAAARRRTMQHCPKQERSAERQTRERRFIYRADFLLAFPEMRAEFEAVTGGRLQARDYRQTDPVELPEFAPNHVRVRSRNRDLL
jgi:hypothetical protein